MERIVVDHMFEYGKGMNLLTYGNSIFLDSRGIQAIAASLVAFLRMVPTWSWSTQAIYKTRRPGVFKNIRSTVLKAAAVVQTFQ